MMANCCCFEFFVFRTSFFTLQWSIYFTMKQYHFQIMQSTFFCYFLQISWRRWKIKIWQLFSTETSHVSNSVWENYFYITFVRWAINISCNVSFRYEYEVWCIALTSAHIIKCIYVFMEYLMSEREPLMLTSYCYRRFWLLFVFELL